MSERAEALEIVPDVDVDVAELRLTVEDQARYIEVLLARLEYVAGQEVELRNQAGTLGEQVTRADADLRRLEAELTQARAAVARLEGSLAVQTAQAQRLSALADDSEKAERLEGALAQAQAALQAREQAVTRLSGELAEAQAALRARDATLAVLTSELAEARAAVQARDEGIAWLQSELALTERRIGRATVKAVGRLAEVYGRLAPYLPGRRR